MMAVVFLNANYLSSLFFLSFFSTLFWIFLLLFFLLVLFIWLPGRIVLGAFTNFSRPVFISFS